MNETTAAVDQVPGLVPIPANQLVQSRPHWDFGITAAVVAAIVTAVASAVAAGIAISQTAAVASTVDSLARQVATAVDTQYSLNERIHQGILQLNLQPALLQEQLDFLWDFHMVSCSPSSCPSVIFCVMPRPVKNFTATVSQLNSYLKGP